MECAFCNELLVDAFGSAVSEAEEVDDQDRLEKTDEISLVGGAPPSTGDTDALLRAAREEERPHPESLNRLPSQHFEYTGDLPRLFRFGERYQILEKLGEGGMGRVYKALDLELDKPVALKTVRMEKGGAEILERFKQELILARQITHKNVVRIHDLGEFEGMKYFTMELVEGQSLGEILKERTKVTVAESVSFMKQMLSGLAEAHSQGVVHRDLKPQNIMLDNDKNIRIMDFGIARTADSATMTGTSEMMGTPDYISPEQVKGETADAQSDLYSFGIILYELLTGETPFKGDTPISKIVARIQTKPASPRDLNPEIPKYLERIILKCLEVDPELRYESADAIAEDLEREQVDRSVWLRARKAVVRRSGWLVAAMMVASLGLGAWYYLTQQTETLAAENVTTLAILPFHNSTGSDDLGWLASGIPEMLITDISQSQSLRPLMSSQIARILEGLDKEAETRFDDETISVVADIAKADYTLSGQFVESGGDIRIDLNLRDSTTGIVEPVKVSGLASEVLSMMDTITTKVSEKLDPRSLRNNRPLAEVSTDAVEALMAYNRGLEQLRRGANQSAIPLFVEATTVDPGFAMALARLAEAYFQTGDDAAAASTIVQAQAQADDVDLPLHERYQIHAIAARINDEPDVAVESYRKIAAMYPDDPEALYSLANSLETLGDLEESIEMYEKVLEIDASYGAALLGLGRSLVVNGRSTEAIERLRSVMAVEEFQEDGETLGMLHSILGVAFRDISKYDEAIVELEASLRHRRDTGDTRGVVATLTNLGTVYQFRGDLDESRVHLMEALDLAVEMRNVAVESFAAYTLGVTVEAAGDVDAAFAYYRRSLQIELERMDNKELAVRIDAIAGLHRLRGQFADARVYLAQARIHLGHAQDRYETALNLEIEGKIHSDLGDGAQALESLLQALSIYQEIDDRRGTASAQLALAEVYVSQGRFDDARYEATESLAAFTELGLTWYVAESHVALGESLIGLEELDEADAQLTIARQLLSDGVLQRRDAKLVHVYGIWLAERKEFGQALTAFEDAARIAADVGDGVQNVASEIEIGRMLIQLDRPSEALGRLASSTRWAEERRLLPLMVEKHLVLAEGHLRMGASQGALEASSAALTLAEQLGSAPLLEKAASIGTEVSSRFELEKAVSSVSADEAMQQ